MDINQLLSDHQIAVMRAAAAGSRETEVAHRHRALCYAERIRALQTGLGTAPFLAGVA